MSPPPSNLWSAVRLVAGLVVPPLARPDDLAGWSPALRSAAHATAIAFALLFLTAFGSSRWADWLLGPTAPSGPSVLRRACLPVAFLLAYGLSLLVLWLGTRPDPAAARHPDLTNGWELLVSELAMTGRPITGGPVFLVFGKPSGGYDALARAAGLTILADLPSDPDAPVRAIACKEAILLAVPGAGGFGPYVAVLADPAAGPTDPFRATGTMSARHALTDTAEVLNKEFYSLLALGVDRQLTVDEDRRMKELGDRITAAKGHARRRFAVAERVKTEGPERLAYVCRLLAAARRPYLPADGALVLLPWGSLADDEAVFTGGPLLAADLAIARATLRQRLPTVTAVCDLEEADGFGAFRRGFSAEKRRLRIGQRLPLVPGDTDPGEYPRVLELTADWVRANVIPAWAVKFVRVAWPPPDEPVDWVPADNEELFRFASGLYARGPRLGRLLASAFPADADATDPADRYPLLAGCYLSATGRSDREQAFVGGVVQRLVEVKGSAGWLGSAVARDAAERKAAVALAATAGGLLLVAAAVAGFAFTR